MKRLNIIFALLLLTTVGAFAQNFRTGYFLDGYMYKYRFNPAFQGERGFVSIPVAGSTSIGVETNLALNTFLYPTSDGKLATFLHPNVSNETFMSKIQTNNPIKFNTDFNILAVGFRAKKTYHTIDVSMRTNVNAALPGDLFRFMKVGGSDGNRVYDFSNLSVNANACAQAAYGFSIKIKDFMSVGLRAKFLLGIQNVQSQVSKLQLSLQDDKWMVSAAGDVMASALVAKAIAQEEISVPNDLTAIFKTPGLGAAFDLGVSIDFLKHFTISASVLDLGFMSWQNMTSYKLETEPWEYTGFNNLGSTVPGESVENQLDQKLEELAGLIKLDSPVHVDKSLGMLGFTTMLGLEFRMPFYDRLTIGALGTRRFEKSNSWTEGRFSLGIAPLRWLSLSANYAISTFGHSYGGALNIHPKGFNLYVGVDSYKPLLNMTPQYIPVDSINTNLEFGITFPFGKYNGRYPKKV